MTTGQEQQLSEARERVAAAARAARVATQAPSRYDAAYTAGTAVLETLAGATEPEPATILDACPDCGARLEATRWSAEPVAATRVRAVLALDDTSDHHGPVVVAQVTGAPDWAAEYALQGFAHVTRYTCTRCRRVVAELARDDS